MKIMESVVVAITPARNEVTNLIQLLTNLESVTLPKSFHWVIVVNQSTDNSLDVVSNLKSSFPITVIDYSQVGNLRLGTAWKAWQIGVDWAEKNLGFSFLMKLDADVRLSENYFECLDSEGGGDHDIVGGITTDRKNREQLWHIQGAVKMYSTAAINAIRDIPRELGFDVLDEIRVKYSGLSIRVCRNARYKLTRTTGSSEGFLAGRIRNGRLCNFVGYDRFYFMLHVFRYAFRKPILLGSFLILYGYIRSPSSPFSSELRGQHIHEQREKLMLLRKKPMHWIIDTYGAH